MADRAGGHLAGVALYAAPGQAETPPRLPRDEADALAILDLPPGADVEAIRQAHRRLIGQVHPDRGGSADLTRRVNAARDLLLARRDA